MEASILALLGCLLAGTPEIDLLDRHDMVWETAPVKWNTGIPLANGQIGALVWGDGNPLKITLDKYDAWETREKDIDLTYADLRKMVAEGRKQEAELCMRTEALYGGAPYPTRLPMPRVEISFPEPYEWTTARLSLRTACAHIEGTVAGSPIKATLVVLADHNIVSIRIEGEKASEALVRVGYDHLSPDAKNTLAKWGYQDPVVADEDHGGYLYQRTPNGYDYAVAWRHKADATSKNIAIALLATTDNGAPLATAQSMAEAFLAKPDFQPHEAWWREYWSRSSICIPDARFESLYYIEMYKLGCSSRPGGLPITLQGLWTLDGGLPPWSGDYHLDMNVQQSYWPIYTANRLELGEPLYRTFSACIPRWREQCEKFFGFDGLWAGCAIGPKGERIFGYSGVELWPGNTAWLAHHYWLHFLYSQDKAFLKNDALPMIRLAFMTYAGLLEKGDDGKLHVPMSYSPEYFEGDFKAYVPDPTCDLALIRFLGDALLKSNAILGEDDAVTARVNDVLAELADYPRDGNGLMVNAGQPLEESHRHHSHLMAIHPLALLSVDGSEDERKLIAQSLRQIRVKGTGEWTGWAFPWMSLIASRARYGNTAWQMLDIYANSFITPNTFHINGDPRIFGLSLFDYEPMTLEAGFGAAAALMDMLLQSQGGTIQLFPSMPDRWHDASFERLRAEGAFVVSSAIVNDEVEYALIESEAGGLCRVKNPRETPARLTVNAQSTQIAGAVIEFPTKPGESYVLDWPESPDDPPAVVKAVSFSRSALETNFYGLKRQPRF